MGVDVSVGVDVGVVVDVDVGVVVDVDVDVVVEGDGDGDGDVPSTTNDYRHNLVSIATTLPSSSIAWRCWSSGRLPSTRTASSTAAHSIAEPRAIA